MLRAHGRPADCSTLAVAREAQALLREKIEALTPSLDAPRHAWRPFFVLVVSFIQGYKNWQTANALGLSERQVSRERARGIALLRAELEKP